MFIENILKLKNDDDMKLLAQNIGTDPKALTNLWQAVDALSTEADKKTALEKLYIHMNDQQRKEFVSQVYTLAPQQQVQATQPAAPSSAAAATATPAPTGQSLQAPASGTPAAPQPQSAQSRLKLLKEALENTALYESFKNNLSEGQRILLIPATAAQTTAPTPQT